MKINSLRMALLAATALAMVFVGSNRASAQDVSIRIGVPPPPVIVEHRWAPPYRDAVWIAGHHEWVDGRWVWVGGYYTYPPHRGAHWIRAHYHHGYYFPGHWDR